jgi:hypothetical protein
VAFCVLHIVTAAGNRMWKLVGLEGFAEPFPKQLVQVSHSNMNVFGIYHICRAWGRRWLMLVVRVRLLCLSGRAMC